MRLIALVESPDHVCCRYRISAFRPFLEQAGQHLEIRSIPRRTWGWFRLGHDLRKAGAIILQRKLLQSWQLFLVRRAAKYLIFDFDDAVFLRDSYATKGLQSRSRRRRFDALVSAADCIVAGNDFLGNQATLAAPRQGIRVLPTCVDSDRYPLAQHHRKGDGVELVWVGSSSTLQGLEAIQPLLEEIGQAHPGLRLKLVCDRFLSLQHLPVIAVPWTEVGEAQAIAAADIGISWLPDDDWSRGKCGLKVLQYMAAGLPVVANPVGVQGEMVRHGETGFLVRTSEEWQEAIGRLAGNPELRRTMGQAARNMVESKYSVQVGARIWLSVLQQRTAMSLATKAESPKSQRKLG